MEKEDLISIIVPAYNAGLYIEETIRSVQQQSYVNWELIIVDDESTDNTANIVRQLQLTEKRIIFLQQKNKKQAAARNTGLKVARGEWIAFIDSDDIWMPAKLEAQINACTKADIIYTGGTIRYQHENKKEPYKSVYGFFSALDMYKVLYDYNPIPNLSVMLKREWIHKIGLQDESPEIVGCEDWDYWIRLAKNGATFYGINEDLFIYRVHASGTSRNFLQMRLAETTALYKNVDFTVLNKETVKKRFNTLIRPLTINMLQADNYKIAKKLSWKLFKIDTTVFNCIEFVFLKFFSGLVGYKRTISFLNLNNRMAAKAKNLSGI